MIIPWGAGWGVAVYNYGMINFNDPVSELIQSRFSCRTHRKGPINNHKREQLEAFINSLAPAPFGSRQRFDLVAATDGDSEAIRGLGTYGFIKNPPAFVLGATSTTDHDLEDFGYLMEAIILYATGLNLGTCWLGGTFTRSRFARKMSVLKSETMPAVVSVGDFLEPDQSRRGFSSLKAGSHRRLPWDVLFFKNGFREPLPEDEAGEYSRVLEMVRLGPSASNKQPWRIIKNKDHWRLYLERTPGYYNDPLKRILGLCDLQRLDMGIAMCHFELTARELGLKGRWVVEDDLDKNPELLAEYVVSWEARGH